jgi:hypothetical protein
VRFKNFSKDPVEYDRQKTRWAGPNGSGWIEVKESSIIYPDEVTEDFDPNDPIVQLMLKAHPELRPIVVPNVWERLRKPDL